MGTLFLAGGVDNLESSWTCDAPVFPAGVRLAPSLKLSSEGHATDRATQQSQIGQRQGSAVRGADGIPLRRFAVAPYTLRHAEIFADSLTTSRSAQFTLPIPAPQ